MELPPAVMALLPPTNGILPYYMLVLSVISVGNSIQNYTTLHFTRRLYNGLFTPNPKPSAAAANPQDAVDKLVPAAANDPRATDQVTPLAARCFGTWTMLTSIVRLYAAYNLHLAPMYNIAIWTYVVALGHFVSELFVYRSMTLGVPQMFPLLFATTALIWMPLVKDYYVSA